MERLLEVKSLTVKIGNKTILEDISLNVEKGEIVAIVGPNGGGKTTLIKTILGFIQAYKGDIKIFGLPPKEAIKTGKIGYLPQKSSVPLDFPFSVLDIVMLGLVRFRLPKKEKIKRALQFLDFVGMKKFKDYPFTDLSGGQQQRVSIARVLVSEPKIVFLDEPSTGVDIVAQENFYEFLKKLKEKKNITTVMVTHDIGGVSKFVDKLIGLNKHLHFYGKPTEILNGKALSKIYGSDVELIIHSPECVSCEHFKFHIH